LNEVKPNTRREPCWVSLWLNPTYEKAHACPPLLRSYSSTVLA
jgi:hypothetical protein